PQIWATTTKKKTGLQFGPVRSYGHFWSYRLDLETLIQMELQRSTKVEWVSGNQPLGVSNEKSGDEEGQSELTKRWCSKAATGSTLSKVLVSVIHSLRKFCFRPRNSEL
ncbi:hypothetical protein L208DRAFT_1237570, partial [Tricholoma matsutake]